MNKITQPSEIIHMLTRNLKPSTVPGQSNDGARIGLRYKAFGKPTEKAIKIAKRAVDAGFDPREYSGVLDRVWTSKAGDLIITLLCKERFDGDRFLFRSFNLNKGDIEWLSVTS